MVYGREPSGPCEGRFSFNDGVAKKLYAGAQLFAEVYPFVPFHRFYDALEGNAEQMRSILPRALTRFHQPF